MGYKLKPNVSFCWVGPVPYFLDLEADKYFRLSGDSVDQFGRLARGDCIDPAEAMHLAAAGAIVPTDGPTAPFPTLPKPDYSRSIIEEASASSRAILARTVYDTACASIALRVNPFSAVLEGLRTAKRRAPGRLSFEVVEHIMSAYRTLDLFLSPEARCIARSTAMARSLVRHGSDFEFVIGVRSGPFGAHCWLGKGDLVLNDRLDKVRDFSPILVI